MDFMFMVAMLFAGLVDVITVIALFVGMLKAKNNHSVIADTVIILAMAVNLLCVYFVFMKVR